MKIGIIGLGSFGSFIAQLCPPSAEVIGFDAHVKTASKNITLVSLEEVAQADIIFLAIPLSAYDDTLRIIKNLVHKDTLIVDICSVKEVPTQKLHTLLPNHQNLLITHPLFGPQSASQSTKGHTLVVTEAQGEQADALLSYCENELGLSIKRITSPEHDKEMATIHALTFFVARTLKESGIHEELLSTPSYKALLELAKLDGAHSEELFLTIEQGNPYAKHVYTRYLEEAKKLAHRLEDKT